MSGLPPSSGSGERHLRQLQHEEPPTDLLVGRLSDGWAARCSTLTELYEAQQTESWCGYASLRLALRALAPAASIPTQSELASKYQFRGGISLAELRATAEAEGVASARQEQCVALEGRVFALEEALRSRAGDREAIETAARDVAALRRRVNELRAATRTRAEAKALRSAALEAGTKRLGVARARLAENDAMVSGAHGRGRLHQQQRALVARRWQLVADLASVFPIAPARTGHQSGGAAESSRGGGKQKRTWIIAGVPLDLGQSGKPQGANSLSNAIGNGRLPGSTVRFFVFPYLQLD